MATIDEDEERQKQILKLMDKQDEERQKTVNAVIL